MGGHRLKNASGERTGLELAMGWDGHMVGPVYLGGQSKMRTRLPNEFITQTLESGGYLRT
jgi:hypothetical protein